MNKKWLFILSLCPLLLIGCNNEENAHSENELVYATPVDINDMNPHVYEGSMAAQGMVYESLVENTEDGIQPLLAESWDISEDGKEYTFHLREDVEFHDGEPFDAEAVKKNIDAVQENPEIHSWIQLSQKIKECNVIDENTVELVLTEPYYPTLAELAMTRPYVFISPKDFKGESTKDGVNGYNGTGPYVLTDHQKEESATFEANNSYWDGKPNIQQITAKVLPSGETTLLALHKGEVNFAFTNENGTDSLDEESMAQLEESGDFQIVRSNAMKTNLMAANSSKENSPISDTEVREAIWYGVDRETISDDITNEREKPANALFSSNVNYADVDLKDRSYDPEKAKTLLDQAGWKMEKGEEVRTKNGDKLALNFYYDSNSSSQKTQAEFLQSTLREIGIELHVKGEDSSSIHNRRKTGDYELLYNQTWGLAYDPESTISAFTDISANLHSTKGIKQAEELYKKIDKVMVTTDEKERQSLYEDILTIVHEEAVFIPITYGGTTVIAPDNLEDINFKQTQFELPFESMKFKNES